MYIFICNTFKSTYFRIIYCGLNIRPTAIDAELRFSALAASKLLYLVNKCPAITKFMHYYYFETVK